MGVRINRPKTSTGYEASTKGFVRREGFCSCVDLCGLPIKDLILSSPFNILGVAHPPQKHRYGQSSSPAIWQETKKFHHKNFYLSETVRMVPGDPLQTHHVNLSIITLKSIVTMMAIFPSLDKFWMLCGVKSVGVGAS